MNYDFNDGFHDFEEGFLSDNRDPMDAPSQDFDWEQLYAMLGEEVTHDQQPTELVTRLVQLIVPPTSHHVSIRAIGLRAIALAWILNPGHFPGNPSLRELAKRCGVNPPTIARLTGELSRLTGWRNRAQRHAWNWKKG